MLARAGSVNAPLPALSAAAGSHFSGDPAEFNGVLRKGIHNPVAEVFDQAGFERIKRTKTALEGEALRAKLRRAHLVGIRSRTQLNAGALAKCGVLRAIGCFCIATNQVDLDAAMIQGVPVVNVVFSNSRGVAKLVLAEAIMLMRDIPREHAKPAICPRRRTRTT